MGEEIIKEGIWTCGRTRNVENKNYQELQELYKDLGILADIKKKRLI
jgi:hypothetical protein